MSAAFSADGLDLAAVAETTAWFETGPPAPWPRRYSRFTPHPLPAGSVRLVVVPVAENCPRLASTAAAVAADMLGRLPPGCKVFSNARQNLHITVFHFSHPVDTRPDAMDPCSGLGHCLAPAQQQSAAAQQRWQRQQQPGQVNGVGKQRQHSADSVAGATMPFTLQFERVLLSRSGVLLLTWSDPSGALARLRRSLQGSFPGACSKQSSIIHTSLFRIVEAPAALRGACLHVSSLWWVCEEEFSSIQGQRLPLPCGATAMPQ
ncbi:hypothetical protein COO60DRAFT_1643656 [Scenedesmus sp. NREL 46B-D3]|nr:hypothetical protein COO60DRAFT_1643656 [Scenedesmus sp. NREL 46B-D3]